MIPTHNGRHRLSYADRYQLAVADITDSDAPRAIADYVNQLERKHADEERAKRRWRAKYRGLALVLEQIGHTPGDEQ